LSEIKVSLDPVRYETCGIDGEVIRGNLFPIA
jgi:hypothetical protein